MEPRFLEPSISRNYRELEPKLVILDFFTVILLPISRTPEYSNQFSFPLEVREIGMPTATYRLKKKKTLKGRRAVNYKLN